MLHNITKTLIHASDEKKKRRPEKQNTLVMLHDIVNQRTIHHAWLSVQQY